MTDFARTVLRLRARYGWFDHALRAKTRFQEAQGSFYAAGITYFTILALWPVLMVAFAAVGALLASHPRLLASVDAQVKGAVTHDFAAQVISLMDEAIDSRASIGIIGLATAAWVGLGWMIARLPRVPMPLRVCLSAGLLASVVFELFKQVESVYLHRVVQGPAGATFGPVLGLMVFAYICAGLVLFATAWAATSPRLRADPA